MVYDEGYDNSVPSARFLAYYDEIIAQDTSFGLHYLLTGDVDPLMFHQANLARETVGGKTRSLFADWVEATTDRRLSVLFTPWGEGLTRSWYRDTIVRLSHLPHTGFLGRCSRWADVRGRGGGRWGGALAVKQC